MLGRLASASYMKVVSSNARAPMAANKKNAKINQKTTRAMPFEALAPGRTRSTYVWALASCMRR